ncbi:hypothetical protein K505DRAFT_35263 [Melanomma pulvis-pyrius CBS 109.77]|uniref:Uncharacterized protein n=1 Tax=Melanomma pulvis-pyrius CBS 109.77 TaxID=1314802 RepID=A0A6A6XC97_9PLEO|nr:hypothetical protein K505DRAFT_35263 [Melanomma pulvis-pyrius CBS 109.77]
MRRRGLAVPEGRFISLTDQSQRGRAVKRRPCNGIASRTRPRTAAYKVVINDVDERTPRLPVASCRLWWQLVEKRKVEVVVVMQVRGGCGDASWRHKAKERATGERPQHHDMHLTTLASPAQLSQRRGFQRLRPFRLPHHTILLKAPCLARSAVACSRAIVAYAQHAPQASDGTLRRHTDETKTHPRCLFL